MQLLSVIEEVHDLMLVFFVELYCSQGRSRAVKQQQTMLVIKPITYPHPVRCVTNAILIQTYTQRDVVSYRCVDNIVCMFELLLVPPSSALSNCVVAICLPLEFNCAHCLVALSISLQCVRVCACGGLDPGCPGLSYSEAYSCLFWGYVGQTELCCC
jgi:hypothetical protein